MAIEEALEILERILDYQNLNKVQEIVFRQAWEGKSYTEIARSIGYDSEYIKQVSFELWRSLSQALGKKVTKNNFQSILKRHLVQTQHLALTTVIPLTQNKLEPRDRIKIVSELENTFTFTTASRQDWGDALDVSVFYGRDSELLALEQWIVGDRCRLVSVLGMSGIGKTALCAKVAERIQEHFDYVIWRSLRNAPPIEELLTVLLKFLSNKRETDLPASIDEKIFLLLKYMRSSRCLVVLDNAESILQSSESAGQYRSGYEGYGQLIRCVAQTRHQSCLLLTSREKPIGLAAKESEILGVQSLLITTRIRHAG